MDRKPSDLDFANFSKEIVTWEFLSPYLGITKAEEHELKMDYCDYCQQKQELLFMWRRKKGNEATWRVLAKACEEAKENSLAEKIREMFRPVQATPTCHSDVVSHVSYCYDVPVDVVSYSSPLLYLSLYLLLYLPPFFSFSGSTYHYY